MGVERFSCSDMSFTKFVAPQSPQLAHLLWLNCSRVALWIHHVNAIFQLFSWIKENVWKVLGHRGYILGERVSCFSVNRGRGALFAHLCHFQIEWPPGDQSWQNLIYTVMLVFAFLLSSRLINVLDCKVSSSFIPLEAVLGLVLPHCWWNACQLTMERNLSLSLPSTLPHKLQQLLWNLTIPFLLPTLHWSTLTVLSWWTMKPSMTSVAET